MSRPEVTIRFSLKVVRPLVEVMRAAGKSLQGDLAAPLALSDLDEEFHAAWNRELLEGQNQELKTLLDLFEAEEFTRAGEISFNEKSAEAIVRACAAIRLHLRSHYLGVLEDEKLESSEVELEDLKEPVRNAFLCYLFLATLQDHIIQYLDGSAIES